MMSYTGLHCPAFTAVTIYALSTLTHVCAEFCPEYGHTCTGFQRCCGQACCIPTDMENHYHAHIRWSVWNMWYFWFVVLFVLMSCFGGCSYYRRHQLIVARQQSMIGTTDNTNYSGGWRFPPTFPISLFTGWEDRPSHAQTTARAANPGPGSTPTAFYPTPPPYAEVMAQPEVYPPNKELPPYPGPQYAEGRPVMSYTARVPASQLPPYTPSSSHGNIMSDSATSTLLATGGAGSHTGGATSHTQEATPSVLRPPESSVCRSADT